MSVRSKEGSGKRSVWIWCYKGQRLEPANAQTYGKGKDISAMIWAGIWLEGYSDLVFLRRDEESPWEGY